MVDATLNWNSDVATACDFDQHPDWIMLALTIGTDDEPPTPEDLASMAAIAERYLAEHSG